jgi:quinolinate synthase
VVSYVNTYAEVKAESDYCCTSSNAAAVVRQLVKSGHARIIFLPDEYLAKNTAAEVGIPIAYPFSDLESSATLTCSGPLLLGWKGRCEVHEKYTVDDIRNVRKQFPGVMVLAHPECSLEVTQAADFTGSTKQMIQYVRDMPKPYYLLLTECSMADNIAAENPHREMLRLCAVRCPHMNEITLEQTLTALEKLQYKVELPTELMDRARGALTRMISLGA